jgi:hypothetical protein
LVGSLNKLRHLIAIFNNPKFSRNGQCCLKKKSFATLMVEGSSSLEHSFGDFENEHGGDEKLEEEECQ